MTLPARTLALFISDLHLQAAHPRTVDAFFAFLEERAMAARALYILGDLFEYWAGDDDLDAPLHRQIATAIRAVRDAGIPVYWIAGNRDFLVGQAFADAAGMQLLAEPHIADIGAQKITLVHGDAECTDDIKYMEFRKQVRQPAWQAQFLAMPLAQRKAIIANLREGSKEAHSTKTMEIMDVTPQAIDALFAATGTTVLIHGHTHRPALHEKDGKRRYVLPDWEPDGEPPRGGWIAIGDDGAITRHDLDGKVLG
ncbi:UDP-2,3-diacylglucosamine diphosphatase [Massilia pseudoviolaceinigra]|uniref:UDP-2,3-diacylglucosamine diphosphatase n=1 Tax=Massilia pseudoviolaceinigra TaxID=3057165 RepID=UPI00279664CF|nr:UDP-2,3-diacylglucosamine diphosphatase [Massilia sp. CCM 9206]MDQ1924766.1 UDP-2,3-diacylglucosamine diphosphatase [Massilia sp. CCM 9206]